MRRSSKAEILPYLAAEGWRHLQHVQTGSGLRTPVCLSATGIPFMRACHTFTECWCKSKALVSGSLFKKQLIDAFNELWELSQSLSWSGGAALAKPSYWKCEKVYICSRGRLLFPQIVTTLAPTLMPTDMPTECEENPSTPTWSARVLMGKSHLPCSIVDQLCSQLLHQTRSQRWDPTSPEC